jgi:hypothetical protein
MEATINYCNFLLSKIRLPISDMAVQLEVADGYFPEGFIGLDMSVKVRALARVKRLALKIYAREALAFPLSLSIMWNQLQLTKSDILAPGVHTLDVDLDLKNGDEGFLAIEASNGSSGAIEGVNDDQRIFSVLIDSVTFISDGD